MAAGLSSGLLAGAGGKYNYQREWETSTDTIRTENRDHVASTDLSILHHAAFALVAESMGDKLTVVKGKMSLLPIQVMSTIFEMQGAQTAEVGSARMALGVLKAMGVTNICFVENRAHNINAFLNERHFLVSPGEIFSTYGSPSEVDFTIVGIHAQLPGRAAKRSAPSQGSADSKELFASMNEAFDQVWETLGVNGGQRLYPIAIYLEI